MVKTDKNKPAESAAVMHRWQWLKWLLLLAWATLWLVQVTAPAAVAVTTCPSEKSIVTLPLTLPSALTVSA